MPKEPLADEIISIAHVMDLSESYAKISSTIAPWALLLSWNQPLKADRNHLERKIPSKTPKKLNVLSRKESTRYLSREDYNQYCLLDEDWAVRITLILRLVLQSRLVLEALLRSRHTAATHASRAIRYSVVISW